MSLSAAPLSSPRLALAHGPAHRTSAPLASILRPSSQRLPLNSPSVGFAIGALRTPAGRLVTTGDYFTAGYEGFTRTPLSTPAPAPATAPSALNSPSLRRAGLSAATQGNLDMSGLSRSLAGLSSTGGEEHPSPFSFAAAGASLSSSSPPSAPSSLSARRRPSLRISDLPPLVLPSPPAVELELENLHLMDRGASGSTAGEGSEAETVVTFDVGCGYFANGKRIPTPYPERAAWLEHADGEADFYF
ncbi:hypothetical protein JCM8097_004333 [Rhodosporidiobolus ruineniae]